MVRGRGENITVEREGKKTTFPMERRNNNNIYLIKDNMALCSSHKDNSNRLCVPLYVQVSVCVRECTCARACVLRVCVQSRGIMIL